MELYYSNEENISPKPIEWWKAYYKENISKAPADSGWETFDDWWSDMLQQGLVNKKLNDDAQAPEIRRFENDIYYHNLNSKEEMIEFVKERYNNLETQNILIDYINKKFNDKKVNDMKTFRIKTKTTTFTVNAKDKATAIKLVKMKLNDEKVKDGAYIGERYDDSDVKHCAEYLWTWDTPSEYRFDTKEELDDFYARLKANIEEICNSGYNKQLGQLRENDPKYTEYFQNLRG